MLNFLKALKKDKYWLYEIRFVLKTNTNIFIARLKMLNTNLLEALVT